MYLNEPFVNTVKLVLDKLYGLLSGFNCPPFLPFDTAIANKTENANGNVKVNVCPSTSEEPHCYFPVAIHLLYCASEAESPPR